MKRLSPLHAVVSFAVACRVVYFLDFRASDPYYTELLSADAVRYHAWARSLAEGRVFEPGAFYQAPLYPHLLAVLFFVFGPRLDVAWIVQLAMGIATIVLLHRIGTRVAGERTGRAAAALGALFGTFLFYETKLLPAALTVLLVAVAVDRLQVAALRDRGRDWTGAGLALGIGALASSGLVVAIAVVGAWVLLDGAAPWTRRLGRLGPLLAAAAAAIAPVTAYNAAMGGEFVLLSLHGGITFHQGNSHAAFVSGGGYGLLPGFSGDISRQREESRLVAAARLGRPMTDAEASTYWFGEGLRYIVENPGEYLHLQARRATLVLDSYDHALEYNAQVDPNIARVLAPLPFGVVLGLAAVRLLAGRVRRAEVPVLLVLAVQAALLFLFIVAGRYRLPMVVPLLVLAGTGLVTLLEAGGRRRAAAVGTAVAVTLASLLALPRARPALYTLQEGRALAERAYAFYRLGRYGEAAELYRRAYALDPRMIRAHHHPIARALLDGEPSP